jgi:hypothetical protein
MLVALGCEAVCDDSTANLRHARMSFNVQRTFFSKNRYGTEEKITCTDRNDKFFVLYYDFCILNPR